MVVPDTKGASKRTSLQAWLDGTAAAPSKVPAEDGPANGGAPVAPGTPPSPRMFAPTLRRFGSLRNVAAGALAVVPMPKRRRLAGGASPVELVYEGPYPGAWPRFTLLPGTTTVRPTGLPPSTPPSFQLRRHERSSFCGFGAQVIGRGDFETAVTFDASSTVRRPNFLNISWRCGAPWFRLSSGGRRFCPAERLRFVAVTCNYRRPAMAKACHCWKSNLLA
jgi:hypothetical protein